MPVITTSSSLWTLESCALCALPAGCSPICQSRGCCAAAGPASKATEAAIMAVRNRSDFRRIIPCVPLDRFRFPQPRHQPPARIGPTYASHIGHSCDLLSLECPALRRLVRRHHRCAVARSGGAPIYQDAGARPSPHPPPPPPPPSATTPPPAPQPTPQ